MTKDIDIWVERLSSLHKSQIRKTVSSQGIQLVQFEILQYLSICNRYSNTAQALSEYLGQTKSSISQSIKLMESIGYVERKASTKDKRVIKLYPTVTGQEIFNRLSKELSIDCSAEAQVVKTIQTLLSNWQDKNQQHGFGQCSSCRHNLKFSEESFQCGLTKETLTKIEIREICREHKF